MQSVEASLESGGLPFTLPSGRCTDVEAVLVPLDARLNMVPVPGFGAREDYLVPTLDGESREFSETLSYRFYSTSGSWRKASTGGPRDISGNVPTLDTSWIAPDDGAIVGVGLDVSLFVIQRDEGGGQSWFQSCVRVMP